VSPPYDAVTVNEPTAVVANCIEQDEVEEEPGGRAQLPMLNVPRTLEVVKSTTPEGAFILATC